MCPIQCIVVDDEPTARDIMHFLIDHIEGIDIVATCKSALEAITALNKHQVDLVFLDINMPTMSGLSLATALPKSTKVIFTTAYREYAIDGFDLQAVDYLLKPIALERLVQAIQKYRSEQPKEIARAKDYIVVRADRKMLKISFSDIIYMESLSDYVKIHTTSSTVITREKISTIESRLPAHDFIRVHRSFIVAIPAIHSYTAEYVEIHQEAISISRSYREAFMKAMEGGA